MMTDPIADIYKTPQSVLSILPLYLELRKFSMISHKQSQLHINWDCFVLSLITSQLFPIPHYLLVYIINQLHLHVPNFYISPELNYHTFLIEVLYVVVHRQ